MSLPPTAWEPSLLRGQRVAAVLASRGGPVPVPGTSARVATCMDLCPSPSCWAHLTPGRRLASPSPEPSGLCDSAPLPSAHSSSQRGYVRDIPSTVPQTGPASCPASLPYKTSGKNPVCFLKLELNDRNQLFREGFLRGNGISTTSKLQDLFFFFFKRKGKHVRSLIF